MDGTVVVAGRLVVFIHFFLGPFFFFQGLRGPGDGFALLGFDERFRSLGRSLSSVRYDRRLSFFKETFLLCRKNARMPLFFFVC